MGFRADQRVKGGRWALRGRGNADELVPHGSVHKEDDPGRGDGGPAAEALSSAAVRESERQKHQSHLRLQLLLRSLLPPQRVRHTFQVSVNASDMGVFD